MAQYADPFYTNLRTFLNQNRATTGKRPGISEAYGMTVGALEPAYQAQQATAGRALQREQMGLQAGQTESKLALERAGQGIQQEQFGQTQAFNREQLAQQKAIATENARIQGLSQESTGRLQEAQRQETEAKIKMAPWVTAGSLIGGLGTTVLAAKSLGAFSFLSGMFGDTSPSLNAMPPMERSEFTYQPALTNTEYPMFGTETQNQLYVD